MAKLQGAPPLLPLGAGGAVHVGALAAAAVARAGARGVGGGHGGTPQLGARAGPPERARRGNLPLQCLDVPQQLPAKTPR